MIQFLKLRREPLKVAPDPTSMPILQLDADPLHPISIYATNNLPPNAKRRLYRTLLPPTLLAAQGVHPISWSGADGEAGVTLDAEPGSHSMRLAVRRGAVADPFLTLEIGDNNINGFDLHFIGMEDPAAERYDVDRDETGLATHLGTVRRNLAQEERAMRAGLAPGQLRRGSGGLRQVLGQVESFMSMMGHTAYSLEPLSYVTAWLFERCGFAYVRGHALMDEVHAQFAEGGSLRGALDGSTPFRQPELADTVRGRAWAIHDGVLDAIGREWTSLRMIKQIGRHAGVETFPGARF